MIRQHSPIQIITLVVLVAVIATALYIMTNGLGLVSSLDFGAGAYYYADIPNYERLDNGKLFVSSVPRWIHYLLFIVWGAIMYKLWNHIDQKKTEQ